MNMSNELKKKQYFSPRLTVHGDLKSIVKNFTTNVQDEDKGKTPCNDGKDDIKPCKFAG